MTAFKCPHCGLVSKIDHQNWFDNETKFTLQDDDPRILCEHCLTAQPSRLHVETFCIPSPTTEDNQ